jgi:UDP-N-acetylglucosamine transferase subunit ALG13
MLRAIDSWAERRGRTDVFAQAGQTEFRPEHIEWTALLSPDVFREKIAAAEVVVSHAGMGTIITALELAKPIIVMPRRAKFGEQRNDHQLATARRLLKAGFVSVAFDETALVDKLDNLDSIIANGARPVVIGAAASSRLINAIREFINQ